MLVRILTGLFALAVFVPLLVFSDTLAYPIGLAVFCVCATYEMVRCVGLHKKHYISVPFCLVAAAMPICTRLLALADVLALGVAITLVLVIYMLALTVFSHGKMDISQAATALLVCTYIIGAFSCMVYLCDDFRPNLYLIIFLGAWIPDTFAYFTGRLFGKHKLIPDVSPKKTVEGAIGGVVFCIIAFVVFALIYNHVYLCDCAESCNHALPIWLMIVVGFLSAIVSMIGDLSMSVIKRHYGIKDYGKILPGHGGLLDRFDSVLPVAIIVAVVFGIANYAGVM